MKHTTNTFRLCEGSSAAAHLSSTLPYSETRDPPPLAEFEPAALAPRQDGWTPERQCAFIKALADCGIVGEAAARVGMYEQTARRLEEVHCRRDRYFAQLG